MLSRSIIAWLMLLQSALSQPLQGQEFDDDARLWLYIKLDKKLSSKWNGHLYLQNRLNNNVNEYSRGAADIGFTYKLNKKLRVMAAYVNGGQRRLDGSYGMIQQAYGGFALRHKISQFQLQYRCLLQAWLRDETPGDGAQPSLFYERSKLSLKYELNKRLAFYLAEELNTPFYKVSQLPVNRSRTFAGCTYKLSKRSEIEPYFLFQRRFKLTGQPRRDFVYGITYSYSFE